LACALNNFIFASQALFNGGKVKDYFKKVKHFLDRHPNEVLTIIIANPDKVSGEVWQPIFESSGKHFFAYVFLNSNQA
jgi:hypothetical protein